MAKIITGHIGVEHITSDDVSSFQKGVVGANDYLLTDSPDDFSATINANGTISLCDADIIIQGTHTRIYSTDIVTLEAGSNGVTRIDSIIARYTRDDDGIEKVDVLAKTGTTLPPELVQTDIRGAGTIREVALFDVTFNGTIIKEVKRAIPFVNSLEASQNLINALQTKIANLVNSNSSQASLINTLQTTLSTLENNLKKVSANKTFTSPLVVTNKGTQGEMMYVDLQAYVSSYDSKTGANDILTYRIALCDKSHKEKTAFAFYSNGNHAVFIDGVYYSQPFIQRGYVSITPKTKSTETIGTVTIDKRNYNVTRDFYKNTATVTFAKPYATTPTIQITPSTTVGHNVHCSITDINNKGFKIHLERTSTTSTGIYWIAFGTF